MVVLFVGRGKREVEEASDRSYPRYRSADYGINAQLGDGTNGIQTWLWLKSVRTSMALFSRFQA